MRTGRATPRVIRDAAYAQRLEKACDAYPLCPPMHRGRLTWIKEQLALRFKMSVSTETVSRWYIGEAKPRREKNDRLAELLQVDAVWLYMGVSPDMSPRDRKARNAEADGAVNLVAGFIQMDGGNPAFPDDDDVRAKRDHVDLYAIIRGVNYAFHISHGKPKDGNAWQFPVPTLTSEQPAIVLGVVREGFAVRIIEITSDLIEKHSDDGAPVAMVILGDKLIDKVKLESFATRL